MFEYIFSYGTLQKTCIQKQILKRTLSGQPDELHGYQVRQVDLGHGNIYPMVCPKDNHVVEGTIFEITAQELTLIDRYETHAYERVSTVLCSGKQAWVYRCSAKYYYLFEENV